jgi:hypothetical protein
MSNLNSTLDRSQWWALVAAVSGGPKAASSSKPMRTISMTQLVRNRLYLSSQLLLGKRHRMRRMRPTPSSLRS